MRKQNLRWLVMLLLSTVLYMYDDFRQNEKHQQIKETRKKMKLLNPLKRTVQPGYLLRALDFGAVYMHPR